MTVSFRNTETAVVSLDQLQDRMSSLMMANQQLEVTRDSERALEQERITDTQGSIQLHSQSNTALETQLLSLQGQIRENEATAASEMAAEAALEQAEQTSLDHKKAIVQELTGQISTLEAQISVLERQFFIQTNAVRTIDVSMKIWTARGR
jgi:chromosome segregation ATPase